MNGSPGYLCSPPRTKEVGIGARVLQAGVSDCVHNLSEDYTSYLGYIFTESGIYPWPSPPSMMIQVQFQLDSVFLFPIDRPCCLVDSVEYVASTIPEDWERLLLKRATELKKGEQLVLLLH